MENIMQGLNSPSNEPLFVASLPLSLKSSTSFRLSPISSVLATHLHININTHTKNKMESQRFLKCLLFQLCRENDKMDIMQFPAHRLVGSFHLFNRFAFAFFFACLFYLKASPSQQPPYLATMFWNSSGIIYFLEGGCVQLSIMALRR